MYKPYYGLLAFFYFPLENYVGILQNFSITEGQYSCTTVGEDVPRAEVNYRRIKLK
jgi:hypothetical protein